MKIKKTIIMFIAIVIIVAISIIIINKNNKQTPITDITNENLEENEEDKSVINESGNVILKNNQINKTGDSSDLTESDKHGNNAAILVNERTTLDVENTNISTQGKGSSGIAITNTQSTASIVNTNITTNSDRSKGILASNGSQIDVKDTIINTSGEKSSAIATDFGGGEITAENMTINTKGIYSAGVYSTGDIFVSNSNITSENDSGAVIDGNGKITFENTNVTTINGNKGITIYYTGPQGKDSLLGQFKMRGGKLTTKKGPAFHVTNTKAEITLNNVELETSSGILLKASLDEYQELGKENEVNTVKGGEVTLNAINQKLEGNIEVSSESTVEFNLKSGSYYKGTINGANTSKNVKVTVGAGCTLEITGNCHVNELKIEDGATVIYNGYKI